METTQARARSRHCCVKLPSSCPCPIDHDEARGRAGSGIRLGPGSAGPAKLINRGLTGCAEQSSPAAHEPNAGDSLVPRNSP